ncbi:hypothetical protein BDQ17DRAFT_1333780 [Cyathus striatus]|nr:hypothetical protein BDQ17DRAFT_1333780 [Cyathus striatus]
MFNFPGVTNPSTIRVKIWRCLWWKKLFAGARLINWQSLCLFNLHTPVHLILPYTFLQLTTALQNISSSACNVFNINNYFLLHMNSAPTFIVMEVFVDILGSNRTPLPPNNHLLKVDISTPHVLWRAPDKSLCQPMNRLYAEAEDVLILNHNTGCIHNSECSLRLLPVPSSFSLLYL